MLLKWCVLRPLTTIDRRISLIKRTNQAFCGLAIGGTWKASSSGTVWTSLKYRQTRGPVPLWSLLGHIMGKLRPSPILWAVEPAAEKPFVWIDWASCTPCHANQVTEVRVTSQKCIRYSEGMVPSPFWFFQRFELPVPNGELELSRLSLAGQGKG